MDWRRAGPILVVFGLACGLAAACGEPQEPERPPVPTDDDGGTLEPPPGVDDCTDHPDGTRCQGAKVCVRGVCNDSICGDGVVTAPEECDHGTANAAGAGCELDCTWSCAPDDPARDCSSGDPCFGPGTCDPERRTCTPGEPLAAGTSCGAGKMCVGGECIAATCGDAIVTAPEDCDNGDANGPGTGCESDCTFTCSNPATDCESVPCNTVSCSAEHRCQATPDPTKNDTVCDAAKGYVCNDGACSAPSAVCGNGIEEDGEDCDFGAENGKGSGCEATCKFSCTVGAPGTCVDTNACREAPTCTAVTAANGGTGYRCVTGATKADGAACGAGSICLAGACAPSVCGDGFRDATRGEQCDDGNTRNLDACDSSCRFEQVHRAIALKLQFGTSNTECAHNAIGRAIGSAAQKSFQETIDDSIKDGSCSALFKFVSSDLAGQSGPVTVGSLSGAPSTNAGYDGASDLDWWYIADPLTYDGSQNATATLSGSYAGGGVDVSGNASLTLNVGGSVALLRLSSVRLKGPIGSTPTTPTVAAANAPPGHVANERLDPALKSFPTLGGTRSSPSAFLCGNISAASLATMPVAAGLVQGGATACTQGYTAANSMLDVFVGGCTARFGPLPVTAIRSTQPDFPRNGTSGRYTLAVDSASKRVNRCTDEVDKQSVNLSTCLSEAAFSSYFKFATDRVIIKQ